jgi:pimeloyl-ACP methyl ester carboxylesterase
MRHRHASGFVGSPVAIFYDRLIPDQDEGRPTVVMLHGGSHTGSCFLTTADHRPGWAPRFADCGWPVVVPDLPGHGRSGGALHPEISGELLVELMGDLLEAISGPVVLLAHSIGAAFAWRIAELRRDQIAALVALAPAPPGNIQVAADVEEETAEAVQVSLNGRRTLIARGHLSRATPQMVDGKLIGTSRQFPRTFTEDYRSLLTPTAARLVYERANVGGSQLQIGNPGALAQLPIVIVTGSEDVDHPQSADADLGEWLAGWGAAVDVVWLPDHGIEGNGHMLMMELNSDEIADLVIDWLDRRVVAPPR